MKKKNRLIFSLAVLIILGASLILLRAQKEREIANPEISQTAQTAIDENKDYRGPQNIIKISSGDFISIEYVSKNEQVIIEYKDSSWSVGNGQYNDNLSIAKLSSLFRDLINLRSMETVADSTDNIEQWGISGDSDRINIKIDDEVTTLVIGSLNPSQTGYYIQIEGGKEIYLISSSYSESLTFSVNDFREKSLPYIDVSKLSMLEIRKENTIRLVPFERTDIFTADIFHFMLVKPYDRPIPVANDKLSDLLEQMVSSLSIVDFVDSDSPEDYGINKNALGIILQENTGNTLELLIGDDADKDTVYAKLADKNQLFTLKKEDLPFLDIAAFDFVDRFPHIISIDSISEVTVETNGNIMAGSIKRQNDLETYSIDGNETEEKSFKDFYQNVLYLLMEGEADKPVDKSSSLITITYHSIDRQQSTELNFYPYDDEFYTVGRNDNDPLFTIGIYQLEDMLKKINLQ